MATTTPAPTLDRAAAMPWPQRLAARSRRLGLDWLYLVLGLPAGIATFTIVVTGWSLVVGLLITLVGLPLALAMIYVDRGMAQLERRRAALVLGAPIETGYAPLEGGFWHRLRVGLTDLQKWKDFGWHVLLLPLGIAGFVVATVPVAVLGLVVAPAWWWTLTDKDPMQVGLYDVTSWPLAFLTTVIALVVLPFAVLLVRGTAAGTAALARAVLGPTQEQLQRRVEQLAQTRAGAVSVAASDLERLERDLHDGAQARLVAVAMELGMAEEQLAAGEGGADGARERVAAARDETRRALGELRDLARGMRPGLLAERGLQDALSSLAARSAVPATVRVDVAERPPASAESAAYYVVAEALANAGKHAQATRVTIDVRRAGRGALEVVVADDGRGAADPHGRGLDGLRKRVEALDGRLTVTSPQDAGTHVRAEIPCAS